MAKLAVLTFTTSLLLSCSRDEPIKIPEPLASVPSGEVPIGGDNATGDTGSDPVLGEPDPVENPGEPDIPTETEMNLPVAMKFFFAEPHEAIGDLASFYNPNTGLWPEGWRTSAYALSALIDYMDRTKTLDFTWILDTTFRKNAFVKESFEDNLLWGVTWLQAYDLTKEVRYLDASKQLYEQVMAGAWDTTCGGGLYAKPDKAAKTSVANLLALRFSAMLAQRIPAEASYQTNVQKIWDWISSSPLMSENRLLKHALTSATCAPTDAAPNTQSQGLMISALAAMHKYDNHQLWLDEAKRYAEVSAMEFRNADGIFIEKSVPDCKPCANEEALYKGAMIQGLVSLFQQSKDETWSKILNQNAAGAWNKSKGTGGLIGYKWQSASDGFDGSRQAAGALLLVSQISKPLERNYAFNGDTRTSANCTTNEVAGKAFDASGSTKWCGQMISGGVNHLSVDLGAQRMVKTVRILHAGTGGEARTLNTKDFELQISSNGSDFTELASIRGNQSSMSMHKVSGTGRYLRLRFTNPGADNIGRIYEMSAE